MKEHALVHEGLLFRVFRVLFGFLQFLATFLIRITPLVLGREWGNGSL